MNPMTIGKRERHRTNRVPQLADDHDRDDSPTYAPHQCVTRSPQDRATLPYAVHAGEFPAGEAPVGTEAAGRPPASDLVLSDGRRRRLLSGIDPIRNEAKKNPV